MILIVDDKRENLFSLKALLELNRYNVDTALSGEEALKKILKAEYALIILDVQMPGMDGYEVAETITGYSKSRSIPIIFLSAVNIDKSFIAKGYASGGVDYVTKPFDPDLLLLKVKTFIKLYEQTRELKLMQTALQDANEFLEGKVKERTKELQQTNEELEASNIELQQYASLASHDLQEPLRKILIFSKLVQQKFLAEMPEADQYMNKIINSSERMRDLINDLLDYSKLSVNSHFIPCNLNAVLKDTMTDLEIAIGEKNAQIVVENLPGIEVIPGQIRQLFQNIISNGLKFSREGVDPVIKIWSEHADAKTISGKAVEKGQYVRLFIQDNGIGFNEMYLSKIFTIFQRLHGKEYEGTGIGLAIVKKIVDKHNGLLSARSKEGEGTTFIIVLPVKQTVSSFQPALPE
ncbi:MAG: response regulator [Chitinophagaceae bacterium]